MKRITYLLLPLLLLFLSCQPDEQKEPVKPTWQPLFNGNDLTDWDIKIRGYELGENPGNTFRVEDSMLKVSYDQYDQFNETFGHIFHKEKFSHYILAVEYRFTGEQCPGGPGWALRNSGMMIHSQSAKSMGVDQDFPISIEVQLLGGDGTNPRPTCNLCTPGTNVFMADTLFENHCINSSSETYHLDQWVRAEVMVLGDSIIKHIVEGDTVLSYSKPQIGGGTVSGHDPAVKVDGKMLTEGYISLQSESHPIEFRKVELMNLKGCMDPKAKNYGDFYVKGDKSSCVY
jgi:hypothetical protein